MTQDELNIIIKNHQLWLDNDSKGERADCRNADLQFADLRNAILDYRIVSISGIGSRNDTIQYNAKIKTVICGCYKGTLDEFEAKCRETHANNPQFLNEYLTAITFFRGLK